MKLIRKKAALPSCGCTQNGLFSYNRRSDGSAPFGFTRAKTCLIHLSKIITTFAQRDLCSVALDGTFRCQPLSPIIHHTQPMVQSLHLAKRCILCSRGGFCVSGSDYLPQAQCRVRDPHLGISGLAISCYGTDGPRRPARYNRMHEGTMHNGAIPGRCFGLESKYLPCS